MKNRVLSLLFGTALFLGSFTMMSFQQDAGDPEPVNTCIVATICINGPAVSCRGNFICIVAPGIGVFCDSVRTMCP